MVNEKILEQIIKESKFKIFETGIERELLSHINKFTDDNEIISITGIRRSGKTTLLYQLIKKINKPQNTLYINFEDERLFGFDASSDFENLLEVYYSMYNPTGKIYLFFDEIQEISQWEKWVRRIYDSNKDIKIFVTGSSSSVTSSELSSLLTGRNLSFILYPFSFTEFLLYKQIKINSIEEIEVNTKKRGLIKKNINEYIEKGGFPECVKKYRIELLQQYFNDIIFRDIIKRYKIRDVKLIEELYLYLFTNMSNLYSYNNLKKTFKTGIDTVKEYINYGINSHLFYEHIFFSYSLKEAFQKNKKIYIIDNSLRNAVCFKFSEDTGRLVENLVCIELLKRKNDIYYYYDSNEVDFVIKNKDNSLIGINVCYSDNIPEREINGLKYFSEKFKKKVRANIIITKDYEDHKDNITYIPLWKWLLQKSNN